MSATRIRSKDGTRVFDVTVAFMVYEGPQAGKYAVYLTLEDGSAGSVWLTPEEFEQLVFTERS